MSEIFHITRRPLWDAVSSSAGGEYRGETLETEGFIHASDDRQLLDVANRFYQGVGDLVVLRIDSNRLRSRVVRENGGDVDELFPHIYGPIHVDSVIDVFSLAPDAEGRFRSWPL